MAKNQKLNSSQLNEFENSPQFSELLSDPEFIKGYAQGEALAQTIKQTPMQPEVTAEAIQPEPQFVQPSSTRYVPISEETPEPSVYDQMLAASGDKEQKNLLYKLMAKSMQQQEAGVKQAEEALKKEQERQAGLSTLQKLDLRPFAEAARAYGATTAVSGYAPEMTESQRQEVLRKLQGQLQAAQQGLTKEQVAALRQMKEDKAGSQALISQSNQDLRIRGMINTSEQAKKIRNIGTLNTKLANLENLVSNIGAEVSGADKAKLESAFKDAEVAWKEAANLGALQGPDIEMIRGALGQSPTTGKGLFGYALSGGKEGLLSKIRGARERAILEGQGHLENVMTVFPYTVADPIFKDLGKKLEITPSKAGAKTKSKISSKDIDSMSKEELKKFLGE